MGDSLTSGYGIGMENSYPSFLQTYVSLPVINSGVSGDTTWDAINRLQSDVIEKSPAVVIVELGANDFAWGLEVTEIKSNFDYIIEEVSKINALVVIGRFYNETMMNQTEVEGIVIPDDVKADIIALYNVLTEYENVLIVEDIWQGVWGDEEYMYDSVHPNIKGAEQMAENYLSYLKPLFEYNDILK